jgi:hypothetical protein
MSEDKQAFEKWPKIPRMTHLMQMVITEKLDGTNAQINITEVPGGYSLQAGSRNRWLTPDDDNFGFAKWCYDNRQALIEGLGLGRHFGEWCGPGIQKNIYDLEEKTLFLFNTLRWHADNPNKLPCGIEVVPVIYTGGFDSIVITDVMEKLLSNGSELNSCAEPEGVIIYLPKSRQLFKRTFKYEEGKWGEK